MSDIKITKYYLTKNECYISGGKIKPAGIVVHSTGANNKKLSRYIGPDDGKLGPNKYNNHWNQKMTRQVCCHAFIGVLANNKVACYQTLPWDMKGWHCGGTGNNSYIGFEICEDDLTNKAYFEETYEMAAQLCAFLVKKYNISVSKIISHKEAYKKGMASNHGDPESWWKRFGKDMDDFRKRVENILKEDKEEKEVKPSTPAPAPTTTTNNTFKAGDLVKITKGAQYYSGKDVPDWVEKQNWFIYSIKNDRAVIDKSEDGKNNIMSPINVKFLTKVDKKQENKVETTKKEDTSYKVKVTAGALNVRIAPNANSGTKVLKVVHKGDILTIIKEQNGWGSIGEGWVKLSYTEKYQEPVKKEEPTYKTYTTTADDTLWGIAKKELGSGSRYTEIVKLNNLTSTVIRAGMTLKIPKK